MASSGKWIDSIGPEMAVADAARRSLEVRLAVVAHFLPLAAYLAEHDIEHVHRLRVATRRADAARKLYCDWLPKKSARWIKKRLRQIRRAAGDARDLDVLIERLRNEPGAKAEPIVRYLTDRRKAVQPVIVELADKLRHDDRFVRKSARLLERIAGPGSSEEAEPPVRLADWAPEQLGKFRSAFIERLPNESADIDALHQFRIRGKALRYAIELLAPAFEGQLRNEVYPAVEELQEKLGKITDHIAAKQLLSDWQSHEPERGHVEELGDLMTAESVRQAEEVREFREWWTQDRADWFCNALSKQAVDNFAIPTDSK